MSLPVDELLKPRIKRINKWPGMPHNCPELLKISGDRFYFPFDLDMELGYPLSCLSEWSHLVRPLEWWEDRKPIDLPVYVKLNPENTNDNGQVFKILSIKEYADDLSICHSNSESDGPFENHVHIKYFIPATHAEYLSYINSK